MGTEELHVRAGRSSGATCWWGRRANAVHRARQSWGDANCERRHYNAVRPHSSLGHRPAPEAILPPARGLPYASLRSAHGLAKAAGLTLELVPLQGQSTTTPGRNEECTLWPLTETTCRGRP